MREGRGRADDAGMESPLATHLARHSSHAPPPGVWTRDIHQNGPVVAFVEPMLAAFGRGFRAGFARWGFPLAGMGHVLIDGWLYLSAQDLTDPEELARRLPLVEALGDLAALRDETSAWLSDVLPVVDAARRAVAPGPLADRSDEQLADDLVAAYGLLIDLGERRMTALPGINLLTAAFLVDGEEAGLTRSECLALLAGSSHATTSLARAVTASAGTAVGGTGVAVTDEYADDLLSPDGLGSAVTGWGEGWWRRASAPAADLGTPEVAPALTGVLADARAAQDVREASRELFLRLLGRSRRIAVELGRRLAATGALDEPDDVTYLTPAEVVAVAAGELAGPVATALVRSRRHDVAVAAAAVPEPMLGAPAAVAAPVGPPPELGPGAMRVFVLAMSWLAAIDGEPVGTPAAADAETVLLGVPASPGTVTAPVRVVLDVDDVVRLEPGEILVCGTTTPAWCVALSVAAGVVSTGGGDCSHTAIAAREFAIPAVVGVTTAATRLRTGDVVTLDGTSGTVALQHR